MTGPIRDDDISNPPETETETDPTAPIPAHVEDPVEEGDAFEPDDAGDADQDADEE